MKLCFLLLSMTLFSNLMAADFTNESELGIVVATGNTKTKNYNARQENSYKFDDNALKFDARYINAYAGEKESARYLFGGLRYERVLSDRFSVYLGQSFESDKFAGYNLRHISDAGLIYHIIKAEMFYWLAEAGYRYTAEKRLNGSHDYTSALRAYTELEKKFNESVSSKYFLEYIPSLQDSKDYQINTEISVSAALNTIFSIKSAYLLRYDHQPAPGIGTKTDTLVTTALVAKF